MKFKKTDGRLFLSSVKILLIMRRGMCDSQKIKQKKKRVKLMSQGKINGSASSLVVTKTVENYLKFCYNTNDKRLSVHY